MTIGVFQALIIILVPTVPAFFVLRIWLRGLWLVLATPLAAVVEVGALIGLARMMEVQGVPHDLGPIAGLLLAAWLLAFVIALVLLAITAAVGRSAGSKPPAAGPTAD